MNKEMIEIMEMIECGERLKNEYLYQEIEFNNWRDRAQKRENFINKIDLAEIECITNYWKATEAVRFLSKLVTTIVTMK
ncbi:MAG: hypothetical protein ACRCXT_11060 [Paraclostridium sp.]